MDTSDIKKGLKFMYDGQPYVVVDFQFVKPGKGQAFTRTRMKNMLTGNILEKNLRSGERMEAADVEERSMQYIYPEGDMFVFMNQQSGEQVSVSREAVGDGAQFLMDGIECQIVIYQGNPVSVALPAHITVQVLETEPGARGDTATNVNKPAKVSTGAIVGVPLFISEGEWIRVDTRDGKYMERVKNPTG
ncbi:MAG TPA: elongation factor P [Polyangiaceae bacterium]|jgi:elongation factor P|nr:elongation factor P [Polyangiaceae bacterium]